MSGEKDYAAVMERSLRVALCRNCVEFRQERDYYREKCRIYERQLAECCQQQRERRNSENEDEQNAIFPWNAYSVASTEQSSNPSSVECVDFPDSDNPVDFRNSFVNAAEEVKQTQYIGFPSAHVPNGPLEREECGDQDKDETSVRCQWGTGEDDGSAETCPRRFACEEELMPHLRAEHLNGPESGCHPCRWRGCPRSGIPFSMKSLLLKHVGLYHSRQRCPYPACGLSFPPTTFPDHVDTHTRHPPLLARAELHDAREELARDNDQVVATPSCLWTVYDCEGRATTCGRSFGSKREVSAHVQREHVAGGYTDQYACLWEGCARRERPFNNRRLIMAHVSRMHVDDRQFPCPYDPCPRSFYFKYDLERHELTHTGFKFECPLPGCLQRYSRLTDMHCHLRVNHGAEVTGREVRVPGVVSAKQEPRETAEYNGAGRVDDPRAQILEVVAPQFAGANPVSLQRCEKGCQTKMGKKDRQALNSDYWKLGSVEEQFKYLDALIEIVSEEKSDQSGGYRRQPGSWRYVRLKCRFFVHVRQRRVQVCKFCFKMVFGETESTINKVVEKRIERLRQNGGHSRVKVP